MSTQTPLPPDAHKRPEDPQGSPAELVRSGTPIVKALTFVEERLGGAGTWEVNFPAPEELDADYLDQVRELSRRLRELSEDPAFRASDGRPALTKVLSATDGIDLIPVTPTVTNPTGAPAFLTSDMNTPATFVQFANDETTTVHVPPPSSLEETDRVTIGAAADKCHVQLPASVLAPVLNIPSRFTATIDRTQAQWTADPGVAWQLNLLRLTRRAQPGMTGGSTTITYNVRPSWRAAQGSGDVVRIIDTATEIPGWTSDLAAFEVGDKVDALMRVARGEFDGELAACSEQTSLVW